MLDAKAAMLVEKLFDRCSFVRRRVIEQYDDWAAQMAQQLTHEHTDFILTDVVIEEQIVQSQAMPAGLTGIPEMTEILSRRPWR